MRPPASTYSTSPNIPGNRCLIANCAMRARCEKNSGELRQRKPPTRSRLIKENASSKSSTLLSGAMRSWTPSFAPAASTAFNAGWWDGVVGFQRTPMRLACGTASFSISSDLAPSSVRRPDSPVMFPPGRARLATCPTPTGSAWSEHDGDRFGGLAGGFHEGRRRREDDVDIHADQFGREFRQLVDPFRPAELNDNVLALDVAVIAQSRPQR